MIARSCLRLLKYASMSFSASLTGSMIPAEFVTSCGRLPQIIGEKLSAPMFMNPTQGANVGKSTADIENPGSSSRHEYHCSDVLEGRQVHPSSN